MPSKTVTTVQGQMWDHLSLAQYGREHAAREVANANLELMDMLILPGGHKAAVPADGTQATKPVRSLPPWERM